MVRGRRSKRETVVYEDANGKRTTHLLPMGIRAIDLDRIDHRDFGVIADLYDTGRRSRSYFKARDQMDVIQKLKAFGLVEPIKVGKGNYAYDLTKFALYALKHHLIY